MHSLNSCFFTSVSMTPIMMMPYPVSRLKLEFIGREALRLKNIQITYFIFATVIIVSKMFRWREGV